MIGIIRHTTQRGPRSRTRFGPYEILSPPGRGGMREVYHARDTRLNRTVAISILRNARSDPRRRFAREAKAIAVLAHAHIADDAGQSPIKIVQNWTTRLKK